MATGPHWLKTQVWPSGTESSSLQKNLCSAPPPGEGGARVGRSTPQEEDTKTQPLTKKTHPPFNRPCNKTTPPQPQHGVQFLLNSMVTVRLAWQGGWWQGGGVGTGKNKNTWRPPRVKQRKKMGQGWPQGEDRHTEKTPRAALPISTALGRALQLISCHKATTAGVVPDVALAHAPVPGQPPPHS